MLSRKTWMLLPWSPLVPLSVGGGRMLEPGLGDDDARCFMEFLKSQCADEPAVFKRFGHAVKMFADRKISVLDVVSQADDLFSDRPVLRASFNSLVPCDKRFRVNVKVPAHVRPPSPQPWNPLDDLEDILRIQESPSARRSSKGKIDYAKFNRMGRTVRGKGDGPSQSPSSVSIPSIPATTSTPHTGLVRAQQHSEPATVPRSNACKRVTPDTLGNPMASLPRLSPVLDMRESIGRSDREEGGREEVDRGKVSMGFGGKGGSSKKDDGVEGKGSHCTRSRTGSTMSSVGRWVSKRKRSEWGGWEISDAGPEKGQRTGTNGGQRLKAKGGGGHGGRGRGPIVGGEGGTSSSGVSLQGHKLKHIHNGISGGTVTDGGGIMNVEIGDGSAYGSNNSTGVLGKRKMSAGAGNTGVIEAGVQRIQGSYRTGGVQSEDREIGVKMDVEKIGRSGSRWGKAGVNEGSGSVGSEIPYGLGIGLGLGLELHRWSARHSDVVSTRKSATNVDI